MIAIEINNSNWYLVYTKANQEERARKNLENQDYQTFMPMISYKNFSKANSFLLEPMFPRYLFVSFNPEKNDWTSIKSTKGVSHIVMFGSKIAKVPKAVVRFLKEKVDHNDVITLKMINQELQKGDKIVIKEGAFKGRKATYLSKTGNDRVKVLLKLMSELIVTEIPEKKVQSDKIIEAFRL